VITRLRRAIAVVVALCVYLLTLGRVSVNRTGRAAASSGAEDPGRPAVSRLAGLDSSPGADPSIPSRGR
jgi:hypothetical protein